MADIASYLPILPFLTANKPLLFWSGNVLKKGFPGSPTAVCGHVIKSGQRNINRCLLGGISEKPTKFLI
jgi:hypothetical protein